MSVEFPRQEYWSGLPCPPPEDCLDSGIEPVSLYVSCIGRWVLYHWHHLESPLHWWTVVIICCSVTKRCSTQRPHELQSARLSCPSRYPGACSNSWPLNRWCHPAISSSVTLVSSCPQSSPASGSFPLSICPNPWNVQPHEWTLGLPWQSGGWESSLQGRRRGLPPWSRKTAHALEQLSSWARVPQPRSLCSRATSRSCWNLCVLKPVLSGERNHVCEKPEHCN